MNLPLNVGLQSFDELWTGKYLNTLPDYDALWKNKIQSDKIKVGIRWSGNPLYEQDLHRTLPLDKLIATFDPDKYQLYSFQKDDIAAKIKDYPNVIDLNEQLTDWNHTMSAMSQMDIMVSSCTSIAHVAGALDVRTFVLTPIMNYYTWAEESNKPSWYGDNFTLIRQQNTRDWDSPMAELKELL